MGFFNRRNSEGLNTADEEKIRGGKPIAPGKKGVIERSKDGFCIYDSQEDQEDEVVVITEFSDILKITESGTKLYTIKVRRMTPWEYEMKPAKILKGNIALTNWEGEVTLALALEADLYHTLNDWERYENLCTLSQNIAKISRTLCKTAKSCERVYKDRIAGLVHDSYKSLSDREAVSFVSEEQTKFDEQRRKVENPRPQEATSIEEIFKMFENEPDIK